MPATTSSRLATRPFTGAGISGAVQLSRAKLCPTQAGSGRLSTTSPVLQMGAKGLPSANRDAGIFAAGWGAAKAASNAPDTASAARSPAPMAILFNIKSALRIDDAASHHLLLQQRAQRHQALVDEL